MYGVESALQDILMAHPELFPGGDNWQLVPGCHSAGRGWVDILFKIGRRRYAVIEVKRGQASVAAVDQVLAYARALRPSLGTVDAWVAAHIITDAVRRRAAELGVKLLKPRPRWDLHG